MIFKIASFNISGGFYDESDETEYLDKERAENVDDRMLNQIIDTINNKDIDVICFQEIITTERIQYIQTICENTDLKYYDFFEQSECNIVKDTRCGVAILSKYPTRTIIKEFFPNPGLTKTTSSGNTYYLYDKGYMVDEIIIEGEMIKVLTHHGFPYHVFDSTPEENPEVFEFFDEKIKEYNPDVITGDFNSEHFMALMKNTSDNYIRTINDITTVEGFKIDDILIHKGGKSSKEIVKLLSDHYMIISTIEL